jgi:hypothetical protein
MTDGLTHTADGVPDGDHLVAVSKSENQMSLFNDSVL